MNAPRPPVREGIFQPFRLPLRSPYPRRAFMRISPIAKGLGGPGPGRRPDRRARAGLERPVVRPEQGPVPEVRLQDHEDPPFRHLLLSAGRADRQDGRDDGRAMVRAAVAHVQPRAQGPPAPRALRQRPRVPADPDHRRDPGRGDGRRHGIGQAPHHPALRRLAQRDRSRHRPRARPRLPVRHHGPGPFRRVPRQRRGPAHPALVHRGHGRIPVHRPGRRQYVHVDARRRPPQAAAADPEAPGLL